MVMVHTIPHGKGGFNHATWFEKAENEPTKSDEEHSGPLQLESETWQTRPEKEFLRYPGLREFGTIY
jgi:hypothetical protein